MTTRTPAIVPWWLTLAICALATLVDGYDVQALGLTIPLMAKDFGVAPAAFSLAASASLLGMAMGAMFLSSFADRYSPRRVVVPLLILFGLATFGAGFSTSPAQLALWRLVAGLGLGATLPVTLTIASDRVPERLRNALLALVVSFMAVGAFAGGFIVPLLLPRWGWHGVYWLGAAAPLLVAMACIWCIPDRRAAQRAIPDAMTGTSSGLAVDPANPMLQFSRILAVPLRSRTLLLWTLFIVNQFVAYSLISWLPTLLHEAGLEMRAAAHATGLLALGGVVGSLVVSTVADRGAMRAGLLGAYVVGAMALTACGFAGSPTAPWNGLVFVTGFGVYGAQMSLGALVAGFYPVDLRSTGIGWSSGMGRIGSVIGPLVLGGLLAAANSPTRILGMLMAPLLLCAACVVVLPFTLSTKR